MLTPNEAWSVLYDMDKNVGSLIWSELDREMTPILAELMTMPPSNKEHPTAKHLFNWLVDPQRSGEDFHYVVGPLKGHVYWIMFEHFGRHMYEDDCFDFIGQIASEALAHRRPILDITWEPAAWLLVDKYDKDSYGAASDRLSAWLIHVTSDPELCSNPYLRLKLLILLLDISDFKDKNPIKAIELLFCVCSSSNMESLMENDYSCFQWDHEVAITLFDKYDIIDTLANLAKDRHIRKFDEKLAGKLKNIKDTCLSAQPTSFHGIVALLRTLAGHTKVCYKDLQQEIRSGKRDQNLGERIGQSVAICDVLITKFKRSCQTPQLVSLTASCIMGVLELLFYAYNRGDDLYIEGMDRVMGKLIGEDRPLNTINSPIGLELTCKHKEQLIILSRMPRDFTLIRILDMSIPNITALLQSVME